MAGKSGGGGARRSGFDRSAIIDGVLRLAKESPQTAITFRRLGQEIGVDATAMYRHFRDKDEILCAAIDRLYQIALDGVDSSEPSWRARIEQFTERLVEVFLTYPSLAQEAPLIDGWGPGEVGAIDFFLACFQEAGLSGAELITAYTALSSHTLAQSSAMARDRTRSGRSADGFAPWISKLGETDLNEFPHVLALRSELLALDTMDAYRAGVRLILNAAERAGRAD